MKKLILLFLVACSAGVYGQQIANLPDTTATKGTDLLIVDQTDSTRHITISNFFGTVPVTLSVTGNITALKTTEQLRLSYDATNYITITLADDGHTSIVTVDPDGEEADINLNPDGNVGVKTAAPSTALEVTGTITTTALAASGNITGLTQLTLDTDATIVLATGDCDNAARFNNDADVIDYTLPGAAAGLVVLFYDIGGGVITVDPVDGTDTVYLNGTSVGAGDAIDSPGAVGDFICLMAIDATRWVTVGRSGVWVDGGVD